MTKKFAYIEQCQDLHADIVRAGIDLDIKQESSLGKQLTFRSIGRSCLADGTVLFIGEKRFIPDSNRGTNHDTRIVRELQSGAILADRCPELMQLLPSFIGWTDWGRLNSIITEDASRAGSLSVQNTWAPQSIKDQLESGFSEFGKYHDVFGEEIDYTTTFKTGDVFRFLDLTPAPYYESFSAVHDAYDSELDVEDLFDLVDKLYFPLPKQEQ